MRAPVLFLTLVAAPALRAQDALVKHPEGALVVFECDGPAAWSRHFAGTKILQLVQSKKFAEVFAPVQRLIDAGLAQAKQGAPIDVQAAYDGALAYAGRVRVVVMFDMDGDGEPQVAGYVAAGPDGATDLPTVCKEIERLALSEAEPKPVPRTVAGLEWMTAPADDATVTLPRMVGNEAAMLFFTAERETEVEKLFTKTPAAGEADEQTVPLRLQMNGKKLLHLVLAANVGSAPDPEGSERLERLIHSLCGTLGSIDLRLRAERKFVDFVADIELPGERGALFALIAPVRDRTPALLDCVPRQHTAFACGPLDLGQIETIVKQVLEIVPEMEMDWPKIEAMVEEHAGVRLTQDVLAHLGSEFVWLGSPVGDEDAEAGIDLGPFKGACLGLALDDGAAFARALETILDRTGVLRMRKTEKYRDLDLHRMPLPIVNEKLHWTVTDKLWLIAVGDQGLKHLQALLDGAATAARGEQRAAFPRHVTERLAVVAPKYCSLSFQTMNDSLDMIGSALTFVDEQQEMLAEEKEAGAPDFDVRVVIDMLEGLKELLRDHDLEHALTVTYHEKNRLAQRMIW